MDLKQLKYFIAIVEEGSFTKAAARLHVAQPSLSLHVKNMEAALGVSLLLRGSNGITATDAGNLLVQKSRLLLDQFGQIQDDVRSLGHAPSGSVRLGLPGTISDILAAPLITRCYDRYPKIKIIIAEAMSGFVNQWLHEGRIDMAILYTDRKEASIQSQALLAEELVLLMPPSQKKSQRTALELLQSTPLILPSNAHGLRQMLNQSFREQPISLDPIIEVDSYANIKHLVAEGYGLSILPNHAVAAEAEQGRLTLKRFPAPRLWRSAYLTRLTGRSQTQAITVVQSLIKDTVVDLVSQGQWIGAKLHES